MRLALLWLLLAPEVALAHDFTPGVLSMEEGEPGLYRFVWTPPVDSGSNLPVEVAFPDGCKASETEVDCRAGGLAGAIEFRGLADQRVQVVVIIRRRDGTSRESMVWGDAPRLVAGDPSSPLGWVVAGMEHVLTGYDHIAFLIGLLLVTGFRKRIILTITAFTLAHSLTLALAALHLVRVATER